MPTMRSESQDKPGGLSPQIHGGDKPSGLSKTLLDKIWNAHVVTDLQDGRSLIYIDRHLIHEVTSPQAFEGLRLAGRPVRRPDLTFATVDHNVPTTARHLPMAD